MKTTSCNTNIWTGHRAGLSELCGYDVELHLQTMQSNILQKMWTELPFYLGMCTTIKGTQIKLLSKVLRYWTLICTRQTTQHNNELIKKLSTWARVFFSTYSLKLLHTHNASEKNNLRVNTPTSSQYIPSNILSCFCIDIYCKPRCIRVATAHRYKWRSLLPAHVTNPETYSTSHSCQQTYRLGFAGLF